jgi:hypothetical protein
MQLWRSEEKKSKKMKDPPLRKPNPQGWGTLRVILIWERGKFSRTIEGLVDWARGGRTTHLIDGGLAESRTNAPSFGEYTE